MNEEKVIILKTMNYIKDNINESLTLDNISKAVGYSKFHLCRLFSKNIGTTIYKYIQKQRLDKAALKLTNTNISICDIAYEANYQSQQAFTLAFRKVYFITPTEYRKSYTIKNVLFFKKSLLNHKHDVTNKLEVIAA